MKATRISMAAAICTLAFPANAAVVSLQLQGNFGQYTFIPGASVGDPFVATITYDTSTLRYQGISSATSSMSIYGAYSPGDASAGSFSITTAGYTYVRNDLRFYYQRGASCVYYSGTCSILDFNVDAVNNGGMRFYVAQQDPAHFDTPDMPATPPSSSFARYASFDFYTPNGTQYAIINPPGGTHTSTLTYGSLGAVPEPLSWVLMIGGFGAVGGGLRFRRVETKFGGRRLTATC